MHKTDIPAIMLPQHLNDDLKVMSRIVHEAFQPSKNLHRVHIQDCTSSNQGAEALETAMCNSAR